MNRKLLALGLTILSFSVIPVSAQTQPQTKSDKTVKVKESREDRKIIREVKPENARNMRGGGFRGKPARRVDPFNGIELTEAQKNEIDKATEMRDEEFEKIQEEAASRMKKAENDFDEKIVRLLNPEQLKTYRDNVEKDKKGFRGPRPMMRKEAKNKTSRKDTDEAKQQPSAINGR